MRESIPRQIDKKSRVPKEEKGVWGSQSGDWGSGTLKEEKGKTFFFKPRADDCTTKQLILLKDIFFLKLYESESEVAQSCLTLFNPMDCSLPGSSIHGIFQARILVWVAISFPRDLPDPGIKPWSPALQTEGLPSEPPGKPLITA